MTEPHRYAQCGLHLRSVIELPLQAAPDDSWDIDIVTGPDIDDSDQPPPGDVIAEYDDGETVWYAGTRTDDGYLLRFYDCGEFVISPDLDRIEVRRDLAGRHDLLPILLAGTCVSFVLGLRGHTVLHASAVEVDGRAIAFVGDSGQGKTTMAALLCAGGARLVTDDVLVADPGQPLTCIGGASELRLRPKAATIVAGTDAATRVTEDDRLAYAPRTAVDQRLELAAVVVPSPSHDTDQVIARRLDPTDAMFTILEAPRVHGWNDPGVLTRDFTVLSELVRQVPVYDVTVPWGPPFDPAIAPQVSALIES